MLHLYTKYKREEILDVWKASSTPQPQFLYGKELLTRLDDIDLGSYSMSTFTT